MTTTQTTVTLTTRYSSHPVTGAGRVTAKIITGAHRGRQATIPYDHHLGHAGTHRAAAANLAARLELGELEQVGNDGPGQRWHVRP